MLAKIVLVGLISYFFHQSAASHTNFEMKRFRLCNNTQGQIKFYGNITKENGNHYITFEVTTPVPWDDNLGVSCLIQSKVVRNVFVELFTIREKNICKAFNKYMGEFWYDIEKGAQLIRGACPIRSGKYHGHHILLDFNKITLQTFPYGKLRFVLKAIDNKNINANMLCLFVEVENKLM